MASAIIQHKTAELVATLLQMCQIGKSRRSVLSDTACDRRSHQEREGSYNIDRQQLCRLDGSADQHLLLARVASTCAALTEESRLLMAQCQASRRMHIRCARKLEEQELQLRRASSIIGPPSPWEAEVAAHGGARDSAFLQDCTSGPLAGGAAAFHAGPASPGARPSPAWEPRKLREVARAAPAHDADEARGAQAWVHDPARAAPAPAAPGQAQAEDARAQARRQGAHGQDRSHAGDARAWDPARSPEAAGARARGSAAVLAAGAGGAGRRGAEESTEGESPTGRLTASEQLPPGSVAEKVSIFEQRFQACQELPRRTGARATVHGFRRGVAL